jgi:hypothetical protein
MRRKQLGTSLASFRFSGLTQSPAEAAMRAGLDPKRRPETLTVDEWVQLDAGL